MLNLWNLTVCKWWDWLITIHAMKDRERVSIGIWHNCFLKLIFLFGCDFSNKKVQGFEMRVMLGEKKSDNVSRKWTGGLIIGDLCFVLLWNWIELNTIVFGFQWGRRWGRIVRVFGRRGRRREGSWNPAKVKMEDAIINFNLNFVVVSSSSWSPPPSSWSPYLFLLCILSLTVLEFCRLILLVIMGSYIRAQFVEANFILHS